MPITSFGIGAAVTPTVVKTTFSHYTNRKPRAKKPTAHISYDQGLHLIRSFLLYASHHTVEEVQAFTAQWVPHPHWIRTENTPIPQESIDKAADLLRLQLGDDGIEAVGGNKWWLWRRKDAELKAEWIEMRSDYNARQQLKEKGRRVMMYVHGGGYFFGSVDEHRYQLQRHARKLKARVFAPRYRLAPQFPFPCGLLDCLASYLHLLTLHAPSEIILAGDSAGGGMILSLMCLLRDQNVPLPAGGILISPWVDLTHSFPSLSRTDELDYIPAHGFMQKPSQSWPPPNEDELAELLKAKEGQKKTPVTNDELPKAPQRMDTAEIKSTARKQQPPLSLLLDGKEVFIKDQIQLYTTNQLISHPLVSPALQPSLGGLPPLLIMVGGGELLRDEQIYIAHKAADPLKYKLCEHWQKQYDPEDHTLNKYKPTPVQLQVWEDLCHVTPTLSFTRPAKFMYRSIAQFGAWALSRAQKRSIEILDNDDSSDESSSESELDEKANGKTNNDKGHKHDLPKQIGKAGDPLPSFKSSMIRQQVDRHGNVYALAKSADLPATAMASDLLGVVKEGLIRHWLAAKSDWDTRYSSTRRKLQRQRLEAVKSGRARSFDENDHPPPSALAGRLHDAETYSRTQKLKKSWGLGMWSSWGWKHDERSIEKDIKSEKHDEKRERYEAKRQPSEKSEVPKISVDAPGKEQESDTEPVTKVRSSSRRRTMTVSDQGQVEGETPPMPQTEANSGIHQIDTTQSGQAAGKVTPNTADTTSPELLTPMFLPKWKQSAHLRDESKDISDAGSTYSHASNTFADNASTRAVFSAPGIVRSDSAGTPTPTKDNRAFDFRPYTPSAPGMAKDHVGGYDTPQSRRSVERLRSNQYDVNDGQSITSSIPTTTAGLDGTVNETERAQPLRSPSAMAVIQAEGVVGEVGNKDSDGTSHFNARDPENQDPSKAKADATETKPELGGATQNVKSTPKDEDEEEPTTPTAPQRPGLYNREDSDFVTASEKL